MIPGLPLLVVLPIRTSNPLNGGNPGNRVAAILKSKERAIHRNAACKILRPWLFQLSHDPASLLPATITLTRISPGTMNAWDGLPASLKAIVDGIADAFGLPDEDPRFTWAQPRQRKGPRGVHAVEALISWGKAS